MFLWLKVLCAYKQVLLQMWKRMLSIGNMPHIWKNLLINKSLGLLEWNTVLLINFLKDLNYKTWSLHMHPPWHEKWSNHAKTATLLMKWISTWMRLSSCNPLQYQCILLYQSDILQVNSQKLLSTWDTKGCTIYHNRDKRWIRDLDDIRSNWKFETNSVIPPNPFSPAVGHKLTRNLIISKFRYSEYFGMPPDYAHHIQARVLGPCLLQTG